MAEEDTAECHCICILKFAYAKGERQLVQELDAEPEMESKTWPAVEVELS